MPITEPSGVNPQFLDFSIVGLGKPEQGSNLLGSDGLLFLQGTLWVVVRRGHPLNTVGR